MSGTKATEKTIGEVEKLTKISKRDLKYFIEQGLMRPSKRAESGYWLYSEEDIRQAQLAALCRSLDFPIKAIRAVLEDPAAHWQEELELHITRLIDKRDRTEEQLRTAKLLLLSNVWEALQIYWADTKPETIFKTESI